MYNRIISTNQFQTTLTSGITSSPTGTFTIGTTSSTGYGSFSLPTGTGNPRVQNESTVPYYFWATVNYGNPTEEVFRISQVSTSGGTITLTYDQRIGQATLNAHVTGEPIEIRDTADMFNYISSNIDDFGYTEIDSTGLIVTAKGGYVMPTATGVSTAYYVSPATYNSTSTSDVYTFFDTSTHSLSIGPVGSFSSANGYTLARIFSNGTKFTQVNDYRSIATLLSITGGGGGGSLPSGTGIVKVTSGVGALASAGDFPILNQNTTGTSGGLSSTLTIASGGTGQTNAQSALNALTQVSGATNGYILTKDTSTGNAIWKSGSTISLPSQTGNSGKFLTTDGTNPAWGTPGGGGGGATFDTQTMWWDAFTAGATTSGGQIVYTASSAPYAKRIVQALTGNLVWCTLSGGSYYGFILGSDISGATISFSIQGDTLPDSCTGIAISMTEKIKTYEWYIPGTTTTGAQAVRTFVPDIGIGIRVLGAFVACDTPSAGTGNYIIITKNGLGNMLDSYDFGSNQFSYINPDSSSNLANTTNLISLSMTIGMVSPAGITVKLYYTIQDYFTI